MNCKQKSPNTVDKDKEINKIIRKLQRLREERIERNREKKLKQMRDRGEI